MGFAQVFKSSHYYSKLKKMSRAKFKLNFLNVCGLYYGLKSDMGRLNMKNNITGKTSCFFREIAASRRI
jgi:hypothetical protein